MLSEEGVTLQQPQGFISNMQVRQWQDMFDQLKLTERGTVAVWKLLDKTYDRHQSEAAKLSIFTNQKLPLGTLYPTRIWRKWESCNWSTLELSMFLAFEFHAL